MYFASSWSFSVKMWFQQIHDQTAYLCILFLKLSKCQTLANSVFRCIQTAISYNDYEIQGSGGVSLILIFNTLFLLYSRVIIFKLSALLEFNFVSKAWFIHNVLTSV